MGQRGVGKTTLLLQYLKSHFKLSEYLYFSADDVYIINSSIYDIAEEFVKLGGKVIVIDEIHKYKNWAIELKSIYDSFPELMIRFSGSSAIEITNPDFARRYSMYRMPIFSFREYLEITQSIALPVYSLASILHNHETIVYEIMERLIDKKILKLYDEFIDVGVYPFYFEDQAKYIDRIHETINTVLYKDLGRLFHIQPDKIDTLKKLLLTICVSKPLELS
ncbi:MAG: AAA family ATPase, partial [Campylobacterales bacterium]|nr:AAA family ATPase [Campylobacterales bacterium]